MIAPLSASVVFFKGHTPNIPAISHGAIPKLKTSRGEYATGMEPLTRSIKSAESYISVAERAIKIWGSLLGKETSMTSSRRECVSIAQPNPINACITIHLELWHVSLVDKGVITGGIVILEFRNYVKFILAHRLTTPITSPVMFT